MNQQASKMEIDRNVMRVPGTGDPNFNIDIQALQGKPGALPAMTALSGGYDPTMSPMQPMQKAGSVKVGQ